MANKLLFQSYRGPQQSAPNTHNHEDCPAYALPPRHALAQLAVTGTLNSTFYVSATTQLTQLLSACDDVPDAFLAKTAVYARQRSYMKDVPAVLCAVLSRRSPALLKQVFPRVIDNARMLRNFVQVMRSGAVGRKSLGTVPKTLIRDWLEAHDDETIFRASVGRAPSLIDIIRLVHPKPTTRSRRALYRYLLGHDYEAGDLPLLVRQVAAFKQGAMSEAPAIPFEMLTGMALTPAQWRDVAFHATWHTTRMNLNTFARHDVFDDQRMIDFVAARLRNADEIRRSRVLPYQLFTTYCALDRAVPNPVRNALHDALHLASRNVPHLPGRTVVCVDVSGSMLESITGLRFGSTSRTRCVDVAALLAACFLRRNEDSRVLAFNHEACPVDLDPRDSVFHNARTLAELGGGGTDCAAPLELLNQRASRADTVIFISDNESWVDHMRMCYGARHTPALDQWHTFKRHNPRARLVCINLLPYATTQTPDTEDILNIGGFSDQVFDLVADFAADRLGPDHWVERIEQTEL